MPSPEANHAEEVSDIFTALGVRTDVKVNQLTSQDALSISEALGWRNGDPISRKRDEKSVSAGTAANIPVPLADASLKLPKKQISPEERKRRQEITSYQLSYLAQLLAHYKPGLIKRMVAPNYGKMSDEQLLKLLESEKITVATLLALAERFGKEEASLKLDLAQLDHKTMAKLIAEVITTQLPRNKKGAEEGAKLLMGVTETQKIRRNVLNMRTGKRTELVTGDDEIDFITMPAPTEFVYVLDSLKDFEQKYGSKSLNAFIEDLNEQVKSLCLSKVTPKKAEVPWETPIHRK